MRSGIFDGRDWDTLHWKRHLETFERKIRTNGSDVPKNIRGPDGDANSICSAGELTDTGRETTLALGRRLRDLYVTRLNFLPSVLDAANSGCIHLRATPIPRALESTQQVFIGLYPRQQRAQDCPPQSITQRSLSDETLFPNDDSCRRFAEIAKAFSVRAAQVWNSSPEMAYINKRIGRYMPAESPVVKVDSHPRLSGILDTINSTLAHGPSTKLPSEFYDKTMMSYLDRINTEEWFIGYQESNEYRRLGIGSLVGDLVQHMVESARHDDKAMKFNLCGCHDTTLAATLTSLGAYDVARDKWPPYTSSIAFELFRRRDDDQQSLSRTAQQASSNSSWWSSLFGSSSAAVLGSPRKPLLEMSQAETETLDSYFVRLRYNDQPLVLPACRPAGRHFENDEGLCTLAAFKEAADSFTPGDWKAECKMNLGRPAGRLPAERPPGL